MFGSMSGYLLSLATVLVGVLAAAGAYAIIKAFTPAPQGCGRMPPLLLRPETIDCLVDERAAQAFMIVQLARAEGPLTDGLRARVLAELCQSMGYCGRHGEEVLVRLERISRCRARARAGIDRAASVVKSRLKRPERAAVVSTLEAYVGGASRANAAQEEMLARFAKRARVSRG